MKLALGPRGGPRFITVNELEYARTYIGAGLHAYRGDAPLWLASGTIRSGSG
jgi:hypothetical protein